MTDVLVDSNVIIDVLTEDPQWFQWSAANLAICADRGALIINPIIYAEVSIAFEQADEVDASLPIAFFRRDPLPWQAAFLAGRSYLAYRRRGGQRTAPLPDFYIGAHAEIAGLSLLTRDVSRYRTYFPDVALISPTQE